MGHAILRCDHCGTDVMEGKNEWKCDCGAVCVPGKTNGWELRPKKETPNKENKVLDFIIMF